ncbi:MAG: PAS domain S-box protein [Desulfobacteraceae bacterium]|nr:MAG: PAS domain S-box protein [Desulfobacteraceae bacterium]
MRLRIIILVLAALAFLSATTGAWLYYFSYKKTAFEKINQDDLAKLELLRRQLSSYLSEHIKTVGTLAGISELQNALERPTLETIYRANLILDNFTRSLEVDVTYLMKTDGVTVCSSNRNAPDSFVDKDFSFRPYYAQAIEGNASTYLALGTTSGKRGIYYSHPVYSSDQTRIIGVAVIKASIEFVEDSLFSGDDHLLFFTDPNGVIFISSKNHYRFKLLWKLSEEAIWQVNETRQFGIGPWEWSGFSSGHDDSVTGPDRQEYFFTAIDIEQYPGWRIIYLREKKTLERQVAAPYLRVIGPVVISISLLTGILVIILYQLAVREIVKRKTIEKELRRSEERYRRIYHKTPVMLHSIDIFGNIIRVSDHWVDEMGYDRKEVIGKPLTSFFTEQSREYAETVIFPRFFRTGFCRDIPYTYVKKNGQNIDTLLSCYGVRNEKGEVIRSLAVSVDVTEKNRVQKALQKAKEQLSSYSQDLEKKVNQRTWQLEQAQENLKTLSKNIIASQEREKASVARELHDHLGQVLTALRIDAVWAERYLEKTDPDAGSRAAKMTALIDDAIMDVREMAFRLRPRVLDDLGLVDALESLLSDFEKRTNVACVFHHDDIPELSDTLATAIYRIGQEAVTNALRHSKATSITVDLFFRDDTLELVVEDNGCGFPVDQVSEIPNLGIEGMKERANLVGGELTIFSKPDEGTRICCTIAMPEVT